jgi:hypothetical protein
VHRFAPLLLALAALGALAGCSADDPSATTTTTEASTTSSEPPATAEPIGTPIDPATLVVGDCFEERVLPNQGATDVDENQTVKVDCAAPHRDEVYLVTQLPEEAGAPFPGADAITQFADDACLEAFEPFIGLDYVHSKFEIGYTVPTEETWLLPDRAVTCFVFDRMGDKISGTARGTAQ